MVLIRLIKYNKLINIIVPNEINTVAMEKWSNHDFLQAQELENKAKGEIGY